MSKNSNLQLVDNPFIKIHLLGKTTGSIFSYIYWSKKKSQIPVCSFFPTTKRSPNHHLLIIHFLNGNR